ncbi:MAG: hypothetical protein JSU63_21925 [Phycisphaerales bacterium]|nr:MAG: hypothetical protein JSU63_21925 [Phycisphaerales bacterium]
MLTSKQIGLFILRLTLFFTVLAIPWPGTARAYSVLFCGSGNVLFATFWPQAVIEFQTVGADRDPAEVKIAVETLKPPAAQTTQLDARMTGYLPIAQVLALILATPIPWSRRWKALVWGFLLVNLFVAVRVWSILVFTLSSVAQHITNLGELSADLISILASPTPAFLVPPLVWLLVVLRPADLARFSAELGADVARRSRRAD